MTDLQRQRARALKKVSVARFSKDATFRDHMVYVDEQDHHRWLTSEQDKFLTHLCWKYREQLTALGFTSIIPEQSPYDTVLK